MQLMLVTILMVSIATAPAPAIASSEVPRMQLDPIAEAYVHLTLEIGEH